MSKRCVASCLRYFDQVSLKLTHRISRTQDELIPEDPQEAEWAAIARDPVSHYLPEFALPKGQNRAYVGPADLPADLRELFMVDVDVLRRRQVQHDDDYVPPAKKQRRSGAAADGEEEDDLSEVGRREGSLAARGELGALGDNTNTFDDKFGFEDSFGRDDLPPLDDYGYDDLPPLEDMPDFDQMRRENEAAGELDLPGEAGEDDAAGRLRRSTRGKESIDHLQRGQLPSLSRLSTPDLEDGSEAGANPLRGFEARGPESQAFSAASLGTSYGPNTTAGWSKSTVRALNVVRIQLAPKETDATEQDGDETITAANAAGDDVMSFEKVSDKSSRRAAAAFFFELLALGTKDCVKLKQDTPYGDIEVTAKEKLWDIEVVSPPAASFPVAATPLRQSSVRPGAGARGATPASVRSRATPRATPALSAAA